MRSAALSCKRGDIAISVFLFFGGSIELLFMVSATPAGVTVAPCASTFHRRAGLSMVPPYFIKDSHATTNHRTNNRTPVILHRNSYRHTGKEYS